MNQKVQMLMVFTTVLTYMYSDYLVSTYLLCISLLLFVLLTRCVIRGVPLLAIGAAPMRSFCQRRCA